MKTRNKKRRRIIWLSVLVLFIVGSLAANWYVKKRGYRNLWHFVTAAGSNYKKSFSASFETLEMKIDDADFAVLKKARDKALKRGVQISEGKDYVDATLKHKGKKIKAKIRLKGHMTDHLEDKKWSFRVHTKKGDAFMGMKIFSLQSPGTRNYIYEWIYHQMMKQEGIIALRYDFIKLKVNDESWGIYAVEENFGEELVQNNERVKGPIMRFDPDLYWVSRINEIDKIRINEEYATMQSAFVDVYDDKNVFQDSSLLNRYHQAIKLIESFRRGKLSTSQVFDVKKLATFHAIIDLVGGHHSIDWSDIKYYFNPETNLLEPVAYESFSVRNTGQLAGAYKYSSTIKQEYITDWHTALFSDADFFREYISSVNHVSDKKWLDGFFDKIHDELENKLATIYNEYYTKQLPMEGYYQNQENMKHILSVPWGFNAYFNATANDSLYINVGGIDALPYEIRKLYIDSLEIKLDHPVIVDPKEKNAYVKYRLVALPLKGFPLNKIQSTTKIKFEAGVLGNKQSFKQKLLMVGLPDEKPYLYEQSTLTGLSFLEVNETTKEITFKRGAYTIEKTLVIPAGYTVKINEATTISFARGAGLLSYSPLSVKGSEEMPVTFAGTDSLAGFITIINTGDKTSGFRHVQFINGGEDHDRGISAALRLYHSPAQISNCVFSSQRYDALRITSSKVNISKTVFSNIEQTALKLNYCDVEMTDVQISSCKNGAELKGAKLRADFLKIKKAKKTGIEINEAGYFQGSDINISKCKTGIEALDNAQANIVKMVLEDNDLGIKAHKKGDVYGPSKVNIRTLSEKGNKVLKEVEKKSTVNISQ